MHGEVAPYTVTIREQKQLLRRIIPLLGEQSIDLRRSFCILLLDYGLEIQWKITYMRIYDVCGRCWVVAEATRLYLWLLP